MFKTERGNSSTLKNSNIFNNPIILAAGSLMSSVLRYPRKVVSHHHPLMSASQSLMRSLRFLSHLVQLLRTIARFFFIYTETCTLLRYLFDDIYLMVKYYDLPAPNFFISLVSLLKHVW
jgi:hypothetical protein